MVAGDVPAVLDLQSLLAYADPALPATAVDGPFLGLVAVEADRVVGYAVAFPGERTAVTELAVAADARRHGYGRALVDRVAATTEADALVVTTPIGNDDARGFYEAVGFEVAARLAGFYDDGTDALRLVRGQ